MANHVGIHTPVFDGCGPEVIRVIAELPAGAASPFAALPAVHYGRFVVASGVGGGTVLVCSAVTDAAQEEYIVALLSRMGDLPDRLWSNCAGWPGLADLPRASDYLRAHVVAPTLPFATWDAPLDRVRTGLAVRRRLVEFAPKVQGHDAAALQRAFLDEFCR